MKMKLCLLVVSFFSTISSLNAQLSTDSITQPYIEETINWLASDKMGGRVNYSKQQLKAADFLKEQFDSFGLLPFAGMSDFYIPFRTTIDGKGGKSQLRWNDVRISDSFYYFFPQQVFSEKLDIEDFIVLEAAPPLAKTLIAQQWKNKARTLIWIKHAADSSVAELVKNILVPGGMPVADLLVVIQPEAPVKLSLAVSSGNAKQPLYNVVGMLPGRSKPEEAIIFSAHYDHVDEDVNGMRGPVFNGANDNASGTTAVLALAKYFAQRQDNERTIVFCLFAGEEIGLLGSRAFAAQVNPQTIKVVINLEMLGVTNAAGKKSFVLTGPGYSDLFTILRENLKGTGIKVKKLESDPGFLFRRSDNYSFFEQGIVAHTIMCSNDEEPCYHKACDDVKNLDIPNMVRVIRGIAQSAATLISGADTPVMLK